MNQWTIHANDITSHFSSEYFHRNDDGTVDIELLLYFRPQGWLVLGCAVSGVGMIATIGVYVYFVRRKPRDIVSTRMQALV